MRTCGHIEMRQAKAHVRPRHVRGWANMKLAKGDPLICESRHLRTRESLQALASLLACPHVHISGIERAPISARNSASSHLRISLLNRSLSRVSARISASSHLRIPRNDACHSASYLLVPRKRSRLPASTCPIPSPFPGWLYETCSIAVICPLVPLLWLHALHCTTGENRRVRSRADFQIRKHAVDSILRGGVIREQPSRELPNTKLAREPLRSSGPPWRRLCPCSPFLRSRGAQ